MMNKIREMANKAKRGKAPYKFTMKARCSIYSEDGMREFVEERRKEHPDKIIKAFYDPTEKYPWAVYEWTKRS